MNPSLMRQYADQHRSDLERAVRSSAHRGRSRGDDPYEPVATRHRWTAVSVWCGYRLIGVGARLVRPDLAAMPRPRTS